MRTLSGVFVTLDAAERACRQLEAHGISREQLSLVLDEACPACAWEEARQSRHPRESLPVGQGAGALIGVLIGIIAVFWPLGSPGAPSAAFAAMAPLSLFDWMLRLFIISTWSLSGAILGGMLAAMVSEAWQVLRQNRTDSPAHSHYVLSIETPEILEADARRIVETRGGRLVEAPAVTGIS